MDIAKPSTMFAPALEFFLHQARSHDKLSGSVGHIRVIKQQV